MPHDDRIEHLRESLRYQANSCLMIVQQLEHDRKSQVFGTIATIMHETAIGQYEGCARQLLILVPGDREGLAALEDTASLRARVNQPN